MTDITLYQFELCPFCNKARAGLELLGLTYRCVEVNPMNKREIAHVEPDGDGKKKVPIVERDGELVRESSVILRWADALSNGPHSLLRQDPHEQEQINEIEKWVDDYLMAVLPAVLYGTWSQAIKAARLTAKSGNFSALDNLKVSLFGSFVMKMIAKRTLAKMGKDKTAETLYAEGLDHLESLLTGPYLVGEQPSLADACVHGALSCVKEFPAFNTALERPLIRSWYERVSQDRAERLSVGQSELSPSVAS